MAQTPPTSTTGPRHLAGRRRRAVAVLAATAALSTAVVTPPAAPARTGATTAAAAPEKRVFILGDSVLLGATDAVRAHLPDWNVALYAFVGQFLHHAIERIRERRAEIGEVVVMHIGNNYLPDRALFRQQLDEAMNELRTIDQVIWLTIEEFDPSRREVNDELRAATGRWPNLVVVDWHAVARSEPGINYSDGVHLTPKGAEAMATLIERSLRTWYDTYACRGHVYPRVFPFGGAPDGGLPADLVLRSPIVGAATTPSGNGYWLAAQDGGVFALGDARFRGSMGGVALNRPIVGMAATPTGGGYWLVASDGGIFSFGDAVFHGSTGAVALNQPIVGMAPTPNGGGYWLVASDGGMFTFGNGAFHGSTGAVQLFRPIVGMARTPKGGGYWLAASDGGIFNFGDAAFHGSTGGGFLSEPVTGIAPTRTAGGYWLVATDGGVFSFGDAVFHGARAGADPDDCFVAVAARPKGADGYWLVGQRRID